jgi:DNA-binding MarR family transcriptional regulator
MTDLKQLFNDLVRLEIELWDAVDARMRSELGLPFANFDVMQVVARVPSCRVYDVAQELSITVGGASKAVDRIEALGHCGRRSNPGDRRSSLIELTPAGHALLAKATVVFEAELERRLGGALSARSLEQLGTAVRTLRAAGARLEHDGM